MHDISHIWLNIFYFIRKTIWKRILVIYLKSTSRTQTTRTIKTKMFTTTISHRCQARQANSQFSFYRKESQSTQIRVIQMTWKILSGLINITSGCDRGCITRKIDRHSAVFGISASNLPLLLFQIDSPEASTMSLRISFGNTIWRVLGVIS